MSDELHVGVGLQLIKGQGGQEDLSGKGFVFAQGGEVKGGFLATGLDKRPFPLLVEFALVVALSEEEPDAPHRQRPNTYHCELFVLHYN